MPGKADVYEHVTPDMERQVCKTLEQRWRNSLRALRDDERRRLASMVPSLADELDRLDRTREPSRSRAVKIGSHLPPTGS